MSRFRGFVFTHNNYTEEHLELYAVMEAKYLIVAKETGASGTRHLQGYVEYEDACSLKSAITRLKPAHVEVRKGTPDQASKYCKKGEQSHEEWSSKGSSGDNFGRNVDIVVEKGSLGPGQGKRSDLDLVVEAIGDGKSVAEVASLFPTTFIKFHKGIKALAMTRMTHRTERPTIEWRWGLSGRGKTWHVIHKHGRENVYIKDATKWWDGYRQQEVILIDDFDGSWPFRNFLRLLDENQYEGEVKCDYIPVNSPFIYVTCEFPPSHFWSGTALEQMETRLTTIVEVTGKNRRLTGGAAD